MRGETLDTIQVAVFAKAPVAGYAKTRLIPLLGPQGAADLQAKLARRTIETAMKSQTGPVSLWCAPDTTHDLFTSLQREFPISLHVQAGDDLGTRMSHAFEMLTQKAPAILIGTDCLALGAEHLASCGSALREGSDAVFIPAEDGGYALVGLRRPLPQIFTDIPWGTSEVMAITRDRLRKLELRLFEAPMLWDIDTPADYLRAEAAGLLN